MKKFAVLLFTVVLLVTMLFVFSVPASADAAAVAEIVEAEAVVENPDPEANQSETDRQAQEDRNALKNAGPADDGAGSTPVVTANVSEDAVGYAQLTVNKNDIRIIPILLGKGLKANDLNIGKGKQKHLLGGYFDKNGNFVVNKVHKPNESKSKNMNPEEICVTSTPVGTFGNTPIVAFEDNAGVLALAMGAPVGEYSGNFAAAIRGFVSSELVEDGVRITSLDLVDGKVSIKVEAETETAGSAWAKGKKELKVLAQVQWKPSLADTNWQSLGDPFKITVGTEKAEEIDISDLVPKEESGYFSVKLYKNNFPGSIFSDGSLTIIVGIACLAVGFLVAMFIFKKKKPATVDETENIDEE